MTSKEEKKICGGNGECLKELNLSQYVKDDRYLCTYNCHPKKCVTWRQCGVHSHRTVNENGQCGMCSITHADVDALLHSFYDTDDDSEGDSD